MLLTGKLVGDIHVSVYKTLDNKVFFYVDADNKDVLPVVYVIEDTLEQYQTNFCQSFALSFFVKS